MRQMRGHWPGYMSGADLLVNEHAVSRERSMSLFVFIFFKTICNDRLAANRNRRRRILLIAAAPDHAAVAQQA